MILCIKHFDLHYFQIFTYPLFLHPFARKAKASLSNGSMAFYIFEKGYNYMTIRSVAEKCGIAASTIYNYYPSKDHLIASFLLQDWIAMEETFQSPQVQGTTPEAAFHLMYEGLMHFGGKYQPLFSQKKAVLSTAAGFRSRHKELRERLAGIIHGICTKWANAPSAFLPVFVAEALLAWAMEQRDFREVWLVLGELFYLEKGV